MYIFKGRVGRAVGCGVGFGKKGWRYVLVDNVYFRDLFFMSFFFIMKLGNLEKEGRRCWVLVKVGED